jgi:hypothetical protein
MDLKNPTPQALRRSHETAARFAALLPEIPTYLTDLRENPAGDPDCPPPLGSSDHGVDMSLRTVAK